MSYHSSYTVGYRKHWIHCATVNRRETCRIQSPNGDTVGSSRSVDGAKKKIRARSRSRR